MDLTHIASILAWSLLPLAVIRFQIANIRGYLAVHALVSALTGTLYAVEGAYSGAFVSVATFSAVSAQAAVGHLFAFRTRLLISLPAIILAIMLKEGGAIALLPLAAFGFARIAEAVRHDLGLRVTMLGCTSLWLTYGALSGLPQIVLFESLGLASNAFAIWRLHLRHRVAQPSGAPVSARHRS